MKNCPEFVRVLFWDQAININDMNTLFATNTVKNGLYFASKVKNEKSNTVNRRGILLKMIVSSFIPIR